MSQQFVPVIFKDATITEAENVAPHIIVWPLPKYRTTKTGLVVLETISRPILLPGDRERQAAPETVPHITRQAGITALREALQITGCLTDDDRAKIVVEGRLISLAVVIAAPRSQRAISPQMLANVVSHTLAQQGAVSVTTTTPFLTIPARTTPFYFA